MKTLLLLLSLTSIFLQAKTVKPKIMHAQDYHREYSHSSNSHDGDDDILFSTFEATGQITATISLEISTEATSEVTSGSGRGMARMSYLDNNRVDITQDIAKGDGEHLQTLLSMMNLKANEKNLKRIQSNFDNLVYLTHNEFLKKIEELSTS